MNDDTKIEVGSYRWVTRMGRRGINFNL